MPEIVAAAAPVEVQTTASPLLRIELLLLTGGSRWDPPGQEGSAWRALHSFRADPATAVTVARDHAWVRISCLPTGPLPRPCTSPVRSALSPELAPSVAAASEARAALTQPTLERLLHDVQLGLLFDAHPYAHPVVGRLGVVDHLRSIQPRWSRATVKARVIGADPVAVEAVATELAQALEALPTHLPPDAAMKAPSPPGEIAVLIPVSGDQAGASFALAMSRKATESTRLTVDSGLSERVQALRACLAEALPGFELQPYSEAPPGWPPDLSIPVHPYLVWTTTGSVDNVQRHLDALPSAIEAMPEAITASCSTEVDAARAHLSSSLAAGHSLVVAQPKSIEDSAAIRVQGRDLTVLPAADEGLFQ